MEPFRFARAASFGEAAALLGPHAAIVAGGTDLVPMMQERLTRPQLLIDVRHVPGAQEIRVSGVRGARIGALSTLASVAGQPQLERLYPALAAACRAVGTPQLRNMATLGGNLCQRPRCWYFRAGVDCWKNGGESCPAVEGINEYLAVLGGGPCWAAHPSDPAVALLALDATITVRQRHGSARDISIEEFYLLPEQRVDRETVLEAGDVVERITLPARFAGVPQVFSKGMQRQAWDFALASVAVVWPKRQRKPRIALGGVATKPWLVNLDGLPPAPRSAGRKLWAVHVADQALRGAKPLSQNAYKVELAKALVRRVLETGRRS